MAGRRSQLSWIEDRLELGGSVLLLGDAGIGKTRLMSEVLARAGAGGRTVAYSSVSSSSLTLPLAPLGHLLPPVDESDIGIATVQRALVALAELGDDEPLLLGVDDAHLLDEVTTVVLHQAVAAGVVQVVATVRSGEPVPAGVDQIWRTPLGARLELQPLGMDAVGELVSTALDGPVDGATVALIAGASSGLPLLVLELIAYGRESGRLAVRSGLWQWSGELGDRLPAADVLGLSVDQVSGEALQLLQLVVLTDPTPIAALERAGPQKALTELDSHRLVACSDDASVVRPAHPLVAEHVAAHISSLQRRQLLRLAIDSFTASGDLHDDDRMRVALWSLECGHDVSTDELRRAARLASTRGAAAETEQLARAAFERDPDFATGRLLGRTLHRLGRYEEADDTFRAIADLPVDDAERADFVMDRVLTLRFGLGQLVEADELLADAHARLDAPAVGWKLTLAEARYRAARGDMFAVLDLWERAAEEAPEPVRYQLAEWVCGAQTMLGKVKECGTTLTWVNDAAARCGSVAPLVPAIGQFWWVLGMAASGDVITSGALAEPFYAGAVQDRNNVRRSYGAMVCMHVAVHRGDLAAAERNAREATLVPPTSLSVRLGALCGLARILALQGRIDEADTVLDQIEEEQDDVLTIVDELRDGARALVLHARGEDREASRLLTSSIERAEEKGLRSPAVQALFDLTRLGHAKRAVVALERLAKVVDGPFVALAAEYARGATRNDGPVLAGVADRALEHELRLVAIAALTTAITVATSKRQHAAAASYEARRREILGECNGLFVPEHTIDLGLTSRETEVARLAATGVPDKAIAADLGLSVRTVNAHLRSVYTKLGIASRADLADVEGLRPHA